MPSIHTNLWLRLDWRRVLLLVVVCLVILGTRVDIGTVVSDSMGPYARKGDIVVYARGCALWPSIATSICNYQRGQVILFNQPGRGGPIPDLVMKRIVAISGDTVALVAGRLYINEKLIDEPYTSSTAQKSAPSGTWPKLAPIDHNWVRVPGRAVFVLGDNRDVSEDSRIYGAVSTSDIRGYALIVIHR